MFERRGLFPPSGSLSWAQRLISIMFVSHLGDSLGQHLLSSLPGLGGSFSALVSTQQLKTSMLQALQLISRWFSLINALCFFSFPLSSPVINGVGPPWLLEAPWEERGMPHC